MGLSRRPWERRPGAHGFWDDFQDALESAHHSLASGAGTIYQSFSVGWLGFDHRSYSQGPGLIGISRGRHLDGSFGIPMHELESALGVFGHSGVTFHAQRFLTAIITQIKNAADWQALNRIAAPLLGQQSLTAGLLYGIGESLVGDVAALLGLAKLVVLAGLYERIKHRALLNFADPMTLTLTLAVRQVPWLNREAKKADEQLWNTLKELKEIARHPVKFIEIVGQNAWKGVVKDWNDLKSYGANPTVTGDFQAGRIMGHALYQIIMMILLVMSVAGVAAKLAARFPWLMRLARIIGRGGKLEELEEIEQGVRAGEGAEDAANSRKTPQRKPYRPSDDKPPPKHPKKPSYIHGASDGGPGKWGEPTTPRNQLGQQYQRLVTGAPSGTEYKVPYAGRESGVIDFDGYDPERNTLLDAKDWTDWPPEEPDFLREKAIKDMLTDARNQVSAASGTAIEWHVPTASKAAEIQDILDRNFLSGIEVVVTPKP